MTKRNCVVCLTLFILGTGAIAEEHDFYRYLKYPSKLVPGIGRNKVDQEGGADAVGYKRRTVQWWPRKGQRIQRGRNYSIFCSTNMLGAFSAGISHFYISKRSKKSR